MEKIQKVILASHNPNKVKEINALLSTTSIKVITLRDLEFNEEIIENGSSLEENARIKAETIYKKFNIPSIGEDTGLEVIALDFKPGVHTARYAGLEKDSDKNMSKILYELKNENNRKARFRTCIFLKSKNSEMLFEGIVDGEISLTKKGQGGFGYDPIFIPNGYKETFAQLPLSEKSKISHRARAMAKLIAHLQNL